MQRNYLFVLGIAGYILLLSGIWAPETHWRLGGKFFSTQLSSQWTGYMMLFFACITAIIQATKAWRTKLPSFWAAFIMGGYSLGFALSKWVRIKELNVDFQTVTINAEPFVTGGFGLLLLGFGGFILLIMAGIIGYQKYLKRPLVNN